MNCYVDGPGRRLGKLSIFISDKVTKAPNYIKIKGLHQANPSIRLKKLKSNSLKKFNSEFTGAWDSNPCLREIKNPKQNNKTIPPRTIF